MCIFDKPKVDTTAQEQQQRDAERARREEEARQTRIRRGMNDIRSLFEGGRYRSGVTERQVAVPAESRAITVIPGRAHPIYVGGRQPQTTPSRDPDQFKVGDKIYSTRAEAEAAAAAIPETRVERTPVFSRTEGLQPYLDQRRAALEGFQFPQLDQQAAEAGEQIDFALARSGLMRSTVASDKRTDLSREMALASAKIAADIDADIAQTRSRAEQERRALEAGLQSTGDRAGAADAATRAVENITSDAPNYSILPDLFGGVASSIGNVRQGFETGQINRRIDEVTRGFGAKEGTYVR